MSFPPEHRSKLHSTNPLERVNREIGRRSDVVEIYPNDAALLRLAGALLIEQNDEWLVSRRYLSAESFEAVLEPPGSGDPRQGRERPAGGLKASIIPTTDLRHTSGLDQEPCRE